MALYNLILRRLGVYPGIDLLYYGRQRQLEIDFMVAPGVDPDVIRFAYPGIDGASVDGRGDLLLSTGGRFVQLLRTKVYQDIRGERREIEARYVVARISCTVRYRGTM